MWFAHSYGRQRLSDTSQTGLVYTPWGGQAAALAMLLSWGTAISVAHGRPSSAVRRASAM
ncbi:hypothetical protein [uncultured Duncaniella sp.]|uniref:hypothetical protein n=1 Tax=uncultured Duncaniella sp. TaxID=2768039 RepID=UPI002711EA05|nr:hypothetical protein [uncultured Duncaniella sp.]